MSQNEHEAGRSGDEIGSERDRCAPEITDLPFVTQPIFKPRYGKPPKAFTRYRFSLSPEHLSKLAAGSAPAGILTVEDWIEHGPLIMAKLRKLARRHHRMRGTAWPNAAVTTDSGDVTNDPAPHKPVRKRNTPRSSDSR